MVLYDVHYCTRLSITPCRPLLTTYYLKLWNSLSVADGKVLLTHLSVKHRNKVGTRKKRPSVWVFFFSYQPSAGAAPWSVLAQQAMAKLSTLYYTLL